MRPEWRWSGAAALALVAGAACAAPYARLAAPYYAAVDRLLAMAHPWKIEQLAVAPDPGGRGSVLRLVGEVRRRPDDAQPAALVVSRVRVGEAIEVPLVFWTLLIVWPAAGPRERWRRVALGVAVFLGLEAITTAAQLAQALAETSAFLSSAVAPAGDAAPLTWWGRWSRFLEAGGNFVVAAAAALATLALTAAYSKAVA